MKLLLLVLTVGYASSLTCPTWFRVLPNTHYCVCGSSLRGAIQCDNDTKKVSIALEYCMTLSNVSGKLQVVAGVTNNVFISRNTRGYTVLPNNAVDLNDFMCTNSSRRGFLCGDCIEGYGYAPNSHNKECAECNATYAVVTLLFFGILPMTICFVLIIVFRLNFPSGFLFPYIVFCQCYISAVKTYTGLFYTMGSSMGPFGQFNLKLSVLLSGLSQYFVGVYYIAKPTCLHYSLSKLQVLCLDYIFCLYPLLLIFLSCFLIELHARNFTLLTCFSKFFNKYTSFMQGNWSFSDSIIHAYATFYFLSFFHLIFLSYSVLYDFNVYDVNGASIKTLLVYDHSIEWFSTRHLPYAIPAIFLLVLLCVCPTIVLCTQSYRHLRRCCQVRPRTQLILNTFVETFSSSYKDGLNNTYDFRFLTPLPMICGLCMFALFPSYNYELRLYFHSIFSLSFLLLALVYAFLKPYKWKYMNVSISFHTTIISINVMIVTLWFEGNSMSDRILASSFTFFSLLPHIFTFFTVVYKCLNLIPAVRRRMNWALGMWFSVFQRWNNNEMESPTSGFPHRLEQSNAYQRL